MSMRSPIGEGIVRVERELVDEHALIEERDEERSRRRAPSPVDARRQIDLSSARLERDDFTVLNPQLSST
jgi:hypothetical protein